MKIRRGFVTNSSSSSFIFKNTSDVKWTKEGLKELIRKLCSEGKIEGYSEEDYDWLIDGYTIIDLNEETDESLKGKLSEFEQRDIIEWYTPLCSYFVFKLTDHYEDKNDPKQYEHDHQELVEALQMLASPNISAECKDCLEGVERCNMLKPTEKGCKCYLQQRLKSIVEDYLSRDYINLEEAYNTFYNILFGSKNALLLLGDVIMYSDYEPPYEFYEALSEYAALACNHMG